MSSSSREGLLAVSGTLTGLGLISTGLRFFARKRQQLSIGFDDWFILLATVTYLGGAICVFIMVDDHGVGEPSLIVTSNKPVVQLNIAWDFLTDTALAATKLSIVCFYRRVFGVSRSVHWLRWFDVVTKATMVTIVLWLIAFLLLSGLQCGTHFSALWNGSFLKYCTISNPFLGALAISDFALELWILLLPIPCTLRFYKSTSDRLSITGLFLLAFVGLGASAAKLAMWIEKIIQGREYFATHKQSASFTMSLYFCMLEAGMSLVAANLPPLWMLLIAIPQKVLKGIRSMHSLRSNSSRTLNEASEDDWHSTKEGSGDTSFKS